MKSQKFTSAEIEQIYLCTAYIQVTTVSDLTNVSGTLIDFGKASGCSREQACRSSYHRIHQECPPPSHWTTWYKALMLICSLTTYKLIEPLGKWKTVVENTRQKWDYYFHTHKQLLYKRTEEDYFEIWENENWKCTRMIGQTITVPSYAVPVDITKWEINPPEIIKEIVTISESKHIEEVIDEYIRAASYFKGEVYLHEGTTWEDVRTALFDTIQAASDGSAANSGGSFGWVIADKDGKQLLRGTGDLYGKDLSSFRAELEGALALLKILCICLMELKIHKQINGNMYINNKATIEKLIAIQEQIQQVNFAKSQLRNSKPIQPQIPFQGTDPEWDLLNSIHSLMTENDLSLIEPTWVKAHQDDNNPYEDLPISAQLNVTADKLASRTQLSPQIIRPIIPPNKHSKAHLDINDQTITTHYKKKIHFAATMKPFKQYLCK